MVHRAMSNAATVRRRRSIRLPSWDYRERGAYFVTICSHKRALLFQSAEIKHELQLAWRSIGRYSHAHPDEFVVMPNHIHGIIWVPCATVGGGAARGGSRSRSASGPHLSSVTSSVVPCAAPLRGFAVDSGSLPAIVRAFKSNTTKRVNALRLTPGVPVWQRNYYEHVIRDDRDLERAREYIIDNPRRWGEDRHNPAHVSARKPSEATVYGAL